MFVIIWNLNQFFFSAKPKWKKWKIIFICRLRRFLPRRCFKSVCTKARSALASIFSFAICKLRFHSEIFSCVHIARVWPRVVDSYNAVYVIVGIVVLSNAQAACRHLMVLTAHCLSFGLNVRVSVCVCFYCRPLTCPLCCSSFRSASKFLRNFCTTHDTSISLFSFKHRAVDRHWFTEQI